MKIFRAIYLKLFSLLFLPINTAYAQGGEGSDVIIDEGALGFKIPTFSDILTFLIRFFFVIAGLAALLYLLWGSVDWVTSGGDKENVDTARMKITNALIGVLVIIATLSIIWSLENIVFQQRLCFGISCPVTLPELLKAPG